MFLESARVGIVVTTATTLAFHPRSTLVLNLLVLTTLGLTTLVVPALLATWTILATALLTVSLGVFGWVRVATAGTTVYSSLLQDRYTYMVLVYQVTPPTIESPALRTWLRL
jgi:hypothetical protein